MIRNNKIYFDRSIHFTYALQRFQTTGVYLLFNVTGYFLLRTESRKGLRPIWHWVEKQVKGT
jgi:hypothetical protein